jgi:hypothetical protein
MSTNIQRGLTTAPIKLIKAVQIFAVRNGKKLILSTCDALEAYETIQTKRKSHQDGCSGTQIKMEGVDEFDLYHLATSGKCPVYGGCKAAGFDPTPLKHLGGNRWLHLELGLTLQGEPPRDGEGYDYLKVI